MEDMVAGSQYTLCNDARIMSTRENCGTSRSPQYKFDRCITGGVASGRELGTRQKMMLVLLVGVLVITGAECEPVAVLAPTETLQIDTGSCQETSRTNESTKWSCLNFQTALELVKQFSWSNRTVSVLIPAGEHVLESPVYVGSTSVELVGVQSSAASLPLTNIQCTYHIEVDQNQLFNLSYVYTDYSLYFNNSKSVSISNIAMRGCQFPIRLDTIGTVEITNSSFQ